MADIEYPMERRAHAMAETLRGRIDAVRNAVAPPGKRPPFHEQLSQREAMDFWTKHRYDETGAQVLANMGDLDIAELDAALAQAGVNIGGQTSSSGL